MLSLKSSGSHNDLELEILAEKQPKTKTGGKLVMRWSDCPGNLIGIFTMQDKHTREIRSREGARGPHMDRWRAQGVGRTPCPCGALGHRLGCFFFPKILIYSKMDRYNFYGIFGVVLLSVSRTYSFSGFWGLPESFFYVLFRCNYLNNV